MQLLIYMLTQIISIKKKLEQFFICKKNFRVMFEVELYRNVYIEVLSTKVFGFWTLI